MKKYKTTVLKEGFANTGLASFTPDEVKQIGNLFKKAGFSLSNKDEGGRDEGIFYVAFAKGKNTASIEEAIANLQKLKKIADKVNYRFAIVQFTAGIRFDVSD